MTQDEWRQRADQRLSDIEKRLSQIEQDDAVGAFRWDAVERRLSAIESSQTWVVRLILGGFVTTLLAFALGGGLVGAGQ